MSALTPKQEAFCLAYLKTGNASEAYRLAYNAANMKPETIHKRASELLASGDIAGRIAELNQSAVSDAVMTRQQALERLSSFANTDLADLVEFGQYQIGNDEDGNPVIQAAWKIKDSALQDPSKMLAISELAATKDGIKIKTHSPLAAIQQLAKMQGWESAAKFEHTSPDGSMGPTRIVIEAASKDDDS
jgi:phage terminase small subunit